MTDALETPYRPARRLLTGHFRETAGYRAVRRRGVGDWLLVATTGGRGRFGHRNGDLIVEEGDWVLVRPGTPHDYGVEETEKRWELVWAHFQPRREWLDWLDWPREAEGLFRLRLEGKARARLERQFADVHALRGGGERWSDALTFNALERLLLDLDGYNPRIGDPMDGRILKALSLIDERIAHKLLVDDIADAVGLSPSRFAHLFKAETGMTIQGHIEARRMQLATDLLRRTGFPIKQIAADAGFESPFYFSQRFRRFMGLSPQQYRQQQDGAAD